MPPLDATFQKNKLKLDKAGSPDRQTTKITKANVLHNVAKYKES